MTDLIRLLPSVDHVLTAAFAFGGALLSRRDLSRAVARRLAALEVRVFGRSMESEPPPVTLRPEL